MKIHRPSLHPSGLTLLELLVVLTILVALSTVAITSTSGVADQARYEATQRTLENVREAIIGQPNMMDTDGTHLRSGFVADMGRLPHADSGSFTLGELLQKTTSMLPYSVKTVEADPEVVLGTGWRGPYLQLAPGTLNLIVRDGWNVEFVTREEDESAQVISFGKDGQDDESVGAVGPYDPDLKAIIKATDYQASIRVPVTVHSANGAFTIGDSVNVAVCYFGPNADDGGLFVATDTSPVTVTDASTLTFTATFGVIPPATTSVPPGAPAPTVGPRALRAYYHETLPATAANTSGPPTTASGQSAVTYLTIRPGANSRSLFINVP